MVVEVRRRRDGDGEHFTGTHLGQTMIAVIRQRQQIIGDDEFLNPFYATGYPITEAYWATVKVAGVAQDVLVQCFERRCLTYTPGNAAGWEVEAGNVGQHYYAWRYGTP